MTERWSNYMPFKSLSEVVDERMPWRMWDLQGRQRTWFIGSHVSFESVADVLDYNLKLLNSRLCTPTRYYKDNFVPWAHRRTVGVNMGGVGLPDELTTREAVVHTMSQMRDAYHISLFRTFDFEEGSYGRTVIESLQPSDLVLVGVPSYTAVTLTDAQLEALVRTAEALGPALVAIGFGNEVIIDFQTILGFAAAENFTANALRLRIQLDAAGLTQLPITVPLSLAIARPVSGPFQYSHPEVPATEPARFVAPPAVRAWGRALQDAVFRDTGGFSLNLYDWFGVATPNDARVFAPSLHPDGAYSLSEFERLLDGFSHLLQTSGWGRLFAITEWGSAEQGLSLVGATGKYEQLVSLDASSAYMRRVAELLRCHYPALPSFVFEAIDESNKSHALHELRQLQGVFNPLEALTIEDHFGMLYTNFTPKYASDVLEPLCPRDPFAADRAYLRSLTPSVEACWAGVQRLRSPPAMDPIDVRGAMQAASVGGKAGGGEPWRCRALNGSVAFTGGWKALDTSAQIANVTEFLRLPCCVPSVCAEALPYEGNPQTWPKISLVAQYCHDLAARRIDCTGVLGSSGDAGCGEWYQGATVVVPQPWKRTFDPSFWVLTAILSALLAMVALLSLLAWLGWSRVAGGIAHELTVQHVAASLGKGRDGAMDGLKTLPMFFIVASHTCAYGLTFGVSNHNMLASMFTPLSMPIFAGECWVDTFFAIEGFLSSRSLRKTIEKQPPLLALATCATRLLQRWVEFSLLVAVLLVVCCFWVYPQLDMGDPLGAHVHKCPADTEEWLSNVLMVSNLYRQTDTAPEVQWYLFVSLQNQLLGTVLLLVYKLSPSLGRLSALAAFVASSCATAKFVWLEKLRFGFYRNNGAAALHAINRRPWFRSCAYLASLLIAQDLYPIASRVRYGRKLVVAMELGAIATMSAAIFAPSADMLSQKDCSQHFDPDTSCPPVTWSIVDHAVYWSMRPALVAAAMCLALVVLLQDQPNLFKAALGRLATFGQLTTPIYLVHGPFLAALFQSERGATSLRVDQIYATSVGVFVESAVLGFVVLVCVLNPMRVAIKLLLRAVGTSAARCFRRKRRKDGDKRPTRRPRREAPAISPRTTTLDSLFAVSVGTSLLCSLASMYRLLHMYVDADGFLWPTWFVPIWAILSFGSLLLFPTLHSALSWLCLLCEAATSAWVRNVATFEPCVSPHFATVDATLAALQEPTEAPARWPAPAPAAAPEPNGIASPARRLPDILLWVPTLRRAFSAVTLSKLSAGEVAWRRIGSKRRQPSMLPSPSRHKIRTSQVEHGGAFSIYVAVATEPFDGIRESVMAAALQMRKEAGGTIVVCDDGLAAMHATADAEADERLAFYEEHDLVVCARPAEGRVGAFPKASNLNNALAQNMRFERNHLLCFLDADSRMPAGVLDHVTQIFRAHPSCGYVQLSNATEVRSRSLIARLERRFNDTIAFFDIRAASTHGGFAPLLGHNVFVRGSALMQLERRFGSYWSETHVSEDLVMSMRMARLGYYGAYVVCDPSLEVSATSTERGAETAAQMLSRLVRFATGIAEITYNPILTWPTRGVLAAELADVLRDPAVHPTFKLQLYAHVLSWFALASGPVAILVAPAIPFADLFGASPLIIAAVYILVRSVAVPTYLAFKRGERPRGVVGACRDVCGHLASTTALAAVYFVGSVPVCLSLVLYLFGASPKRFRATFSRAGRITDTPSSGHRTSIFVQTSMGSADTAFVAIVAALFCAYSVAWLVLLSYGADDEATHDASTPYSVTSSRTVWTRVVEIAGSSVVGGLMLLVLGLNVTKIQWEARRRQAALSKKHDVTLEPLSSPTDGNTAQPSDVELELGASSVSAQ